MSKTFAYIYGKRKPGVKDESVISPERMKEIQATAAKYLPKKESNVEGENHRNSPAKWEFRYILDLDIFNICYYCGHWQKTFK